VRITDFAFEAFAVAEKKTLKDGTKCPLKIGIHSGEVVSGVVGETKPQFSLIGETVNKASRVCSKCPFKKILVSKETYKYLLQYSNNFGYTVMEVEMKGIGKEKVYTVNRKQRNTDYKKLKVRKKPAKGKPGKTSTLADLAQEGNET
jgi:class 3 adenylate cyclase